VNWKDKGNRLTYLSQYILLLVAFCFPVANKFTTIFIGLFGIIWLWQKQYKRVFRIQHKTFVWASIALFLLNIIGMSYSDFPVSGGLEIETKISMLILPLLLLSSESKYIGDINKLMLAFIFGCVVAGLICLGHSTYQYVTYRPWIEHFFGVRLSVLMHLGFFAFHLNLGVLFALQLLRSNNKITVRFQKWIWVALVFISLLILMSTSKNGLILLVINLCVGGVLYVKKTGKIKIAILGSVLLVISFTAVWFSTSYVRLRLIETFENAFTPLKEDPSKSTSIRRVAWKNCIELIQENPLLGVGTGDVKNALYEKYEQYGYVSALEKQIGPHNQYLQSFAELGIFGVLIILVLLWYPFLYGIKHKNHLLIWVSIAFIISCLTESMLERQAGIVLFNFFLPILLIQIKRQNNNDTILSTAH